jgi:SAM-dependent methyltransferase
MKGLAEMATEQSKSSDSIYARFWDQYVENWPVHNKARTSGLEWPGDEWGHVDRRIQELFAPAGFQHWRRAVEIGPGSGKYTAKVLESSSAEVRAYDVSARFLAVCQERCAEFVRAGRLSTHLLSTAPGQMFADLNDKGWRRTVDGFYAIGVMVHIDLQYMIAYLLTAGLVLKPGGKLVMNLANATSPTGFKTLLHDIGWAFPQQGDPMGSSKFEWVSPDLIRRILGYLGFRIDSCDESGRDIELVASLTEPNLADSLRSYLFTKGQQH